MTQRRNVLRAIVILLIVLLAAGAAYTLTYGADLTIRLPQGTIAGRSIGGRSIGITIPGLRRAVAVAVLVDGDPISWSEVDQEVTRAAIQYNLNLAGDQGGKQRAEITRLVLDQLIDQRLILQAARKRGLEISDPQITGELDRILKNFGSEAEFQTALAQRNMTMADVRRLVRINLTVRQLIPLVAQVEISDAELRRLFADRRSRYDQPEQVKVSHILIRAASPEQEERVRQTITLIRGRLARGEKFADMARQYSEDPGSRDRGGDLDVVSKGTLVPEFEKVAFAMKPGEISEPVKTQFGYHIILLHEKKPARRATFEQVKPEIQQQLQQERQEGAFQRWLAAARKQATIRRLPRPRS